MKKEEIMPFDSSAEQVGAWLSLVEMLLAAFKQKQDVQNSENTAHFPDFHLIMRHIFARGAASVNAGKVFPFDNLILKFGLGPFESFCVILALSCEVERKYENVFALLNDVSEIKKPTLGLAAQLYEFALTGGEEVRGIELGVQLFFSPDSDSARFVFQRFADKPEMSRLSCPLSLNKSVLYYLCLDDVGDAPLSDELFGFCEIYQYALYRANSEPLLCHRFETEKVLAAIRSHGETPGYGEDSNAVCLLNIHGQAGGGRRFVLRRSCAELNRDICFADCSVLLRAETPIHELCKTADLLLAHCLLNDSLLCLCDFEIGRENQIHAREFLKALSKSLSLIVLISRERLTMTPPSKCVYHSVEIKTATFEEQQDLWNYFTDFGGYKLKDVSDIKRIVSSYDLPVGHVKDVLALSEMERVSVGEKRITYRNICDAIREKNRVEITAYAELMRTEFTWDDLILSDASVKVLRKVCNRVLYKRVVNDKWEMGRKLPYGRGLSVVLYGPPGTGKTMAAQVIANEIGRDIYRVDLSRMVSKYIGETEKNLGEVFDAARNVNAVLFFDEADALFSKRTEVKEARDKFANTETSYLLQKIEAYNGITVLATNNVTNFDAAFKRRINYFVNIEMPDEESRLKIWQSLISEKLPLDEKVSLKALAKKFELSGSEIKSALIEAAYTAAADDSLITGEILLNAISDEYTKSGRILFEQDKII
ncbi:MAG: ATP-binding protein [Oscillospiraceae bacterium]|nr:ATP-binding protein [Oscillospiraceae bacterium]